MAKVFYAQRLPQATIDDIKRMAKERDCSEAELIEYAVRTVAVNKPGSEPKPVKQVSSLLNVRTRDPILKPSGKL